MANLDHFLILWDEQFHALVAKNLVADPLKPVLYSNPILEYDYRNWAGNHIWLHKQPLFLWQMALSLKLFGYNALAVRLPSVILHAVAVLMIFRIGKICSTERTGFYGALFFAIAFYPLELVSGRFSTDHNDLSFLFYVTASFWAWFEYQRSKKLQYLILTGLFSGCAVLVKWLVGLLIFAIWFLTIGINDKKNWIKLKSYVPMLTAFSISLLVFVPWQIFILWKYPVESNFEFAYNTKHFFEAIEGHEGDIWFHFRALKEILGSGVVIPYLYLLGLIVFVKNMNSNVYRVATVSAIAITYIFYSLAATKMTSFCIIVCPFAFLGLANLIDSAIIFLNSKIKSKKFELVFIPVVLVLMCFFLIRINKIENNHTDLNPHDHTNRKAELEEMILIDKLKAQLGNENYVVFNICGRWKGHIPVMFYTDYIAYDIIPTEIELKKIDLKKYKIAIVDNGMLPDYIKNRSEIVKVDF